MNNAVAPDNRVVSFPDSPAKHFILTLDFWSKATSHSGPTVRFVFDSDEDVAWFEAFTRAKGRQAGQIFEVRLRVGEALRSFDLQLLDWRKSTVRLDPNATFALADEADIEFFTNLDVNRKTGTGARIETVFALSRDDDQHGMISANTATTVRRDAIGKLCLLAIQLSRDTNFHRFAGVDNEADASEFIHKHCQIESRKEIDTSREAQSRFAELRTRFMAWRRHLHTMEPQ
ncbi:MAG: hypothetical protein ACYDHY_09705 [Acidiferrobacterales bacterium]